MFTNFYKKTPTKSSILSEPISISLQREVDNYTRKLEQEKRRLYALEETYNMAHKENLQKKQKIKELKQQQQDIQIKLLETQIKSQKSQIDQAISKYNENETENDKLKQEINSLRKERVLHLQVSDKLEENMQKAQRQTLNILASIEHNKEKTEKNKEQILKLRQLNEEDKKLTLNKYEEAKKKSEEERPKYEILKSGNKKENYDQDIVLTQELLKKRLKHLIACNKEKVKVIEQYSKNLKVIEEAFSQIQENTGINDIDEISNTFIKSEEQNYSLYNYVDILSQDIDNLESFNQELHKKCQDQIKENAAKERAQLQTPLEEKQYKKLKNIIQEKQQNIEQVNNMIKEIKPSVQEILIDLSKSGLNENQNKKFDYEIGFDLTENNLEYFLADIENYINILISYKGMENGDINKSLHIEQMSIKDSKNNKKKDLNNELNLDEFINIDINKELLSHNKLKEIVMEGMEKKKAKILQAQ
ncbi:hypothetical protein IMG5_203420 [Ichthyophthirius multifiliis]|uniref:ODAD1 central coiled coil region domain-containing protein n=1 Tax=Ichthyophthirius multifiliis TaxID=5932 RepID=G0R6A5_ICHMU|nr:hypothetical protein IMG5_203420 [Ichthyophthirius multifiliis]EGR27002.1 hypothetical protein IMG5_203420 [Ichthyophthirius multifiliis]|eukprot:XP_004023886.1 hypothetical protein IMG5_203420 [Ichthyophthirius multifiliis]